jgi:hypothetical protein
MEILKITARKDTPYVFFDSETGILEISGKSLPEDAVKFYAPLVSWIEEYIKSPKSTTVLNLKFIYINTASSKKVIEMISILVKSKSIDKELKINWYYKKDDEEQREEGEDYSDMVNYPFNFIENVRF